MSPKAKIIRASTVPESLDIFCRDQLRQLSSRYEVVALSSPGLSLERVRERESVRVVAIDMQRRISPLKDALSLMRLVACFRRERPWLVHSMTPKAGLLCMVAAWLAGVPRRVHTFTGLVWPSETGFKRRLLMATDRLLCRCATHVIPEGEGVKRDLSAAKITSKPLRLIANGNVRGIDLDYYAKTPAVESASQKLRHGGCLTFVFVGRLVGDKGVNELVEAFARLHDKCGNVRLRLVGAMEPELDPLDKDTVAIIGEHEAIEAVGYQEDVRAWLAASDVYVLPSYREGFPNGVIEAGAMGLPSIVTDVNGSNEIIADGKNGLIVKPADVESLAEAMERMAADGPMRTSMAAVSRRMVAERYDRHLVFDALCEFYRSLE